MIGFDIGRLEVRAVNINGDVLYQWKREGQQPDMWILGGLPLPGISEPFWVEIQATHVDNGPGGDIAIDDLEFLNCSPDYVAEKCPYDQLPCLTTGLCVPISQICDFTDDCLDGTDEDPSFCRKTRNCTDGHSSSHVPGYCNLDENFCGWMNVDNGEQFFWEPNFAITYSFFTGPETDHTSGNGRYLHIETSAPSELGDVATLRSPVFQPPYSEQCKFRFYYNMLGQTIGVLRVFLVEVDGNHKQSQKRTVFARLGQQGPNWERAEVPVITNSYFRLEIEGVRGSSFTGDISIDDFSFSPGCGPAALPPVTKDGSCNFENNDDCNWYNGEANDIVWTRHKGQTPTDYTGPGEDHTLGNESGHYVYINMGQLSTDLEVGHQGRFHSPFINRTDSNEIVTFWYHMLGKGVGCLDLEVHCYNSPLCPSAVTKYVWRKCGSQGMEWIQGSANVGVCDNEDLFQVVFVATAAYEFDYWGDVSDIAIDDISFGPIPPPCKYSNFDM
jgi:hypothetical protein